MVVAVVGAYVDAQGDRPPWRGGGWIDRQFGKVAVVAADPPLGPAGAVLVELDAWCERAPLADYGEAHDGAFYEDGRLTCRSKRREGGAVRKRPVRCGRSELPTLIDLAHVHEHEVVRVVIGVEDRVGLRRRVVQHSAGVGSNRSYERRQGTGIRPGRNPQRADQFGCFVVLAGDHMPPGGGFVVRFNGQVPLRQNLTPTTERSHVVVPTRVTRPAPAAGRDTQREAPPVGALSGGLEEAEGVVRPDLGHRPRVGNR